MRLVLVLLMLFALPASQARADAHALYQAMGLDVLVEIMTEEGRDYGDALAEEMFPGAGGAAWHDVVRDAYDPARIDAEARVGFEAALDAETAPMHAFFASDLGRRIVDLELRAREALLSEETEAEAEALAAGIEADDPRRHAQITAFIDAGDLVENNLAGTMTAQLAFLRSLADGGAFPAPPSDAMLIAQVKQQAAALREETELWLRAYLSFSYRTLSDAELATYVEFWESEPGRALNRTLFATFDPILTDVSSRLGLAAARFMGGEEI